MKREETLAEQMFGSRLSGYAGFDYVMITAGKNVGAYIDVWNARKYFDAIVAIAYEYRPNFSKKQVRAAVCEILNLTIVEIYDDVTQIVVMKSVIENSRLQKEMEEYNEKHRAEGKQVRISE